MATEGILLESPPRLSFSANVNLDAKLTGDGCERNDGFWPVEAAGSIDFNFSVIFQSCNSTDSSDADELFFDGKLLPFFKTTTVPTATENNNSGLQLPLSIFDHGGTLDAISESAADSGRKEGHRRRNSRHSIWRFGRSCSVGSVAPTGPILPYFPPLHRSKSTGSFFPTPPLAAANKVSPSSSKKFAVDPNQRKTYYYSGSKRGSHRSAGGGIRITPVLNVPAPPMVSRGGSGSGSSSTAVSSLFYYLLCSCGGEERLEEAEESAQCNPAKRNGTERVRFVA
ncbi:hypothetical protein KSP39_PZI007563 [Platanthera zijinensis]|uniref:Uncharacterized protein n=1 Tax=Platanthera zijinensis TaxID=2320716 RepID=A0AAP0BMR1_9ASPA